MAMAMNTRARIVAYLTELGFCPHTPNCGSFNACVTNTLRKNRGYAPMFTRISVLIPTRKRVDRLQKMLRSYMETTQDAEWASELIFRVDEDDQETKDFLLGHNVLVGPRHKGYESLPLFFNEMIGMAKGDVLLCGNDDMVFKTKHWAPAILDAANEFPDGVFDFGVTTHNETHYPFSIVSAKAVKKLGFIFDPRIFWGDIYLRDVMAHFGRAKMLHHIEIDHEWAGHSPDNTFMEGNLTRFSDQNQYHRVAVDEAIVKLKSMVVHGS